MLATTARICHNTGMSQSASVIQLRPPPAGPEPVTVFTRPELRSIFEIYGRKVIGGEWRDYALSFQPDVACFAVYRRAFDSNPLFRVEKRPALARRQGTFVVIAADGRIFRRGQELAKVLRVFDPARRKGGSGSILEFPKLPGS